MISFRRESRVLVLRAMLVWLAAGSGLSGSLAAAAGATNDIRIAELVGRVEVLPVGATTWVLTSTGQVLHAHDRLRTGPNSRAVLLWSPVSAAPFGALTEMEILPPHEPEAEAGMHFFKGIMSFFHRDKPGRIRILTSGATAGIHGTEFVLAVDTIGGVERTRLYVIDGSVVLTNSVGTLVVTNSQAATVTPGSAPVPAPGFIANNILQWCFYYPAVLDLRDLPLAPDEETSLHDSLAAYREGDLLAALAKFPAGPEAGSDAKRVYYAALLLSVGQVERSEAALSELSAAGRVPRLVAALRQLIAAVNRGSSPATRKPQLSTELLAASYYEQSQARGEVTLRNALQLARQAATNSPDFSFAWERVAELEFSFGHTGKALDALDRSLALARRNAQALALKGFLLAAQNRTRDALDWFNRAIEADSALGNAWLGRGLCRIRRGDLPGGREDLLVAAALEPQRALLRSYLGKALADAGEIKRADHELGLAKRMDDADPTPWLYSALLNEQYNRINEAIHDLEKSQELNHNRTLYRSDLLLDQDLAMRSVNLARIYHEAGMNEVAQREASRAVNFDYANYSAHLFLANSYLELSDPNLVNLRYETPAESEYLLANLLAPVGAGTLSPAISQQEYSKLFERDRPGLYSSTEYLSRGAFLQNAAQYATFGKFSYDLEVFYRTDPGQRVNNDLDQRQFSLLAKQELTPDDTVLFQANLGRIAEGDVAEYYDPTPGSKFGGPSGVRIRETQEPIISLGYHHQWSPEMHTLLFAARLDDTLSSTSLAQPTLLAFRPASGLSAVNQVSMREDFRSNLEIYSGELQQIWEHGSHNTILGARLQYGHFRTENVQTDPTSFASAFPDSPTPAADQDITTLFKRMSFYGYHQWQIVDTLQLIGGVSYDWLTFPENLRTAPISGAEKTLDRVSPKAGLIWTPAKGTTARFGYSRSIGGASLDQSFQLEPSQVAGFVQSFRSIIPESVAGANAGAKFETFGLSLEQKFPTGTYLGLSGEILNSQVARTEGTFDYFTDTANLALPSGLPEHLDYDEHTLQFTINQLLGKQWALGANYRLSRAVLHDSFISVPDGLFFSGFQPRQRLEGVLHRLDLFAIYSHPSGFFAELEGVYYSQSNEGYSPGRPGDAFWQMNAVAGYRSPRRRVEVALGLLNISDQDYRLSPLNLYNELPRKRTLAVTLQLNF